MKNMIELSTAGRRKILLPHACKRGSLIFSRWMLSQNEPENRYFTKQDPDPPNQILKLFCESFIVLREGDLPSQDTVCQNLSCFIAEWERETYRKLPDHVKDDVYNVC